MRNHIQNKNSSIKTDYYELENKKRVKSKSDWLKVLDNEKQENNLMLDILFYLYDCKNFTSNGEVIARDLNTNVSTLNKSVAVFGDRIIKLLNLKEQKKTNGERRMWNIPFETVAELNNNIFTWKLREELVEALAEKYNLAKRQDESIGAKIKRFIKENSYDEFIKSIENELAVREEFVKKFDVDKILKMNIDDYVIGKAGIEEKGKDSFCYLIETGMIKLGEMRGARVSKFGVWYSKKESSYGYTKKFGTSLDEAFNNVKKEIYNLLKSAENDDYDKINNCKIADIFRGKILSTYYPDKYICIFIEEDIDKFLNALDIEYDTSKITTIEAKKSLLQQYKENNKYFKDKKIYYFVNFLYKTFAQELKIQNTVAGKIDSKIEIVDYDYFIRTARKKGQVYRSRETDYEKINRNKKDVGNRGEKAILEYERDKLIEAGLIELAKKVAICDNDAIGYDIISYDLDGSEMHIEVKTFSGSNYNMDFYITDNELECLKKDEKYHIYYLHDIKNKPKCHIVKISELLENEKDYLTPILYKVSIGLKKTG